MRDSRRVKQTYMVALRTRLAAILLWSDHPQQLDGFAASCRETRYSSLCGRGPLNRLAFATFAGLVTRHAPTLIQLGLVWKD
jgi:hypothetical protein